MDEQVIDDLYNRAVSNGYKKSRQEFVGLLHSDNDVINDMYSYVKSKGYGKGVDDFKSLIGASSPMAVQPKKKEATVSPSGVGSSASSASAPDPEAIALGQRMADVYAKTKSEQPFADRVIPSSPAKSPEFKKELREAPIRKAKEDEELAQAQLTAASDFDKLGEKPKVEQSKYINEQLLQINKDLIGKTEEFVVPEMEYRFGKLGFKFEEAEEGRDYMNVTASNGKATQISLDNFLESTSASEAFKLQKFMLENTPMKGLFVLEKTLREEDKTYNSQKEVDIEIARINQEATAVNQKQKDFLLRKDAFEKEVEELNKTPESQWNTPEFIKKFNEIQKKAVEINNEIPNLISEEEALTKKASALDRSVGSYVSTKAKQGTLIGGISNSILNGFGSILADAQGRFIDISTEILPTGLGMGEDYGRWIAETKSAEIGAAPPAKGQSMESWKESLTENQLDAWEDEVDDAKKKFLKKTLQPAAREGLRDLTAAYIVDTNTTREWEQLTKEGFWGGAILGLAQSLPAMIGRSNPMGWVQRTSQMYAQVSDGLMQEMENDPAFANISESEKAAIIAPIGLVSSVLEAYGLRNVLQSKGIVTSITMAALGKAGQGVGSKSFREIVENEVTSRIAKGTLVIGAAGLAEGETGAAQKISETGFKAVYNMIKGEDLFKNPKTIEGFIKEVAVAGAQEAVGGFVLGVPNAVGAAYSKKGFLKMDDKTFETFENMANDGSLQSAYIISLKEKIASGKISASDAKEELQNYRTAVGVYRQLPDGLNVQQKKEAMNLLKERKDLEQYIEGKDGALVTPQKKRINEINEELSKIAEQGDTQIQSQTNDVAAQRAAKMAELSKAIEDDDLATDFNLSTKLPTDERQRIEKELQDLKEEQTSVQEQEAGAAPVANEQQVSELTDKISNIENVLSLPEATENTGFYLFDRTYSQTKAELEAELETLKQQLDAIQKQAAGEVPVQPGAGVSQEMAQGEPQAEPQGVTQEGQEEVIPASIQPEIDTIEAQRRQELEANKGGLDKPYYIGETEGPTLGEFINQEYDAKIEELKAKAVPQEVDVESEVSLLEQLLAQEETAPTQAAGVSISNDTDVNDLRNRTQSRSQQATTKEEKESANTRVKIIDTAKKAINTLKSVFPDVDIVIHDDEGSYNAAMSEIDGVAGSRGNFFIDTTPDGKTTGRIDINLSKANSRTVAHEIAHGILLKTFGDNKNLFNDFRTRMSKVLKGDVNQQLNDFADQYVDPATGELLDVNHEEFLAELTGILEQQEANVSVTTMQKVAALINEFVSKITGGKFKPFEDTKNTKDVVDFFNTISSAIREGQGLEGVTEKINPNAEPTGTKVDTSSLKKRSSLIEKLGLERFSDMNQRITEGITLKSLGDITSHLTFADRLVTGKVGNKDYLGGILFAAATNRVWASFTKGRVSQIINGMPKNEDGYRYLMPALLTEGAHMSNKDMSNTAIKLVEDAISNGDISPVDSDSRIRKALNRKGLENFSKLYSDTIGDNNLTPELIISAIDNAIVKSNSKFEDRNTFLESLLGKADINLKKRFGTLPSYGALANGLAEPITNSHEFGDILLVIRTKGNLVAVEPKEGDPDYHPSYPWVIRSINPDGSIADVETLIFDQSYSAVNVFPEVTNKQGQKFTYQKYVDTYGDKAKATYLGYMGARSKMSTSVTEKIATEAQPKSRVISRSQINDSLSKASGTTQVATTTGSYSKAANILKSIGVRGDVLDYGAGLGLGTDAMSDVLGRDVESLEINPERWKGRKPVKYTDANQVDKKYDGIVSLNVVNVVPKEIRDFIVLDIFNNLKEGGTAIISSRGFKGDIDQAKNFVPGPEEKSYIIKRKQDGEIIDVFQKGYDGNELVEYVQDLLGDSAEVVSNNTFGNKGVIIKKSSEVKRRSQIVTNDDFKKISSEVLTPKEINSVRSSLRRSSPDSFTLEILDAIAQDKEFDTGYLELNEAISSIKEEGLTMGSLVNIIKEFDEDLIDQKNLDSSRKIASYILNIGELGRILPVALRATRSQLPGNDAQRVVNIGRANGLSEQAISTVLQKRGFTQEAIDAVLGKEAPIKIGVPELFKENQELASIGTTKDYSAYLDTVFPDSEINNIAYHGSNYKFDNFKKAVNPKNVYKEGAYKAGIFFSKDKETAKSYIDNKIIAKISNALNLSVAKNPIVYPVVLDIKNPVIEDRGGKRGIGFDEVNEAYDNKNDAYIAENVKDPNILTDVYVVFKPEQIHILGSKKDIEDFKKFVSARPTLSAAKKVEVTEEFAPGYNRVLNNMFGEKGIVTKSRERGRSEEDTLENAINYLQKTKVYINATDVQREAMVRNLRKEFKKREKAAPSAKKVLGQKKDVVTVTVDLAKERDRIIKEQIKLAKEITGDLNKKRAALAENIKPLIKGGIITAAQARTIINRISKVNLNNPIMVDRLLAYIEKVFDNANYAADMAELRKLQKQARSRNHTSMSNVVKQFTSINPENIPLDRIQDYKEALDFLNNLTPSYSNMNDLLDEMLSYQISEEFDAIKTMSALEKKYEDIMSNEVKTVEDYVNLIKDINSFKRRAFQLLQNEAIIQEDYDKLINMVGENQQTIEEDYKDEITKIKKDLIAEIKNQRPKVSRDFSNAENDLIRRYLEISDADLKSLSPEELFILNDLLENISNGEIDVSRFGPIVSKAYTSSGLDPLAKQINKSKFDKNSEEGRQELSEQESSFWEGLLGMGRAKAGALQKLIISPFNRAIGSYEKFSRDGLNEFLKLKKKYKIDKFDPLKNSKDMHKIGMLTTYLQEHMAQFDSKNKDVKDIGKRDWFKEILNSRAMRDNYSSGKPSVFKSIGLGKSELDVIKEIWDSLPKNKDGNVDPKAVYDSYMANDGKFFTKNQKGFFDDVMAYKAAEITPKQKFANELSGASFKEIPFHMMRVRLDKGKSQIAPTASSENNNVRITAGTGKERVSEKVGAVMTNFEKLFISGIEQTGRDYFLSNTLQDINNTLAGVKKIVGDNKIELINTISYTLSDALKFEFDKTKSNFIFRNLLSARAAQTLLRPIRTAVELGSTLVSYPVRAKTLSGYKSLFGEQGAMKKLLEFTDSPMLLRDNISKAIDINDGSIEPQSRFAKATNYLSGLPERTMMVTSWMPTFKSEFKTITGIDFDMKKFNDSSAYREKYGKAIRESSAAADAQTEKIIGPTTKAGQRREIRIAPRVLANIFGSEGTVSKNSATGQILGFFSNYPFRESTEFLNGFREAAEVLNDEGALSSLSQLQKPLGVALNVAAYSFLSSATYALSLMLLGDDDDEERGEDLLKALLTGEGLLEELKSNAISLAGSQYAAGGKALIQLAATILIESTDDEEQKAKYKKLLKDSVFIDPLPVDKALGFKGEEEIAGSIGKYIPQFIMAYARYTDLIGTKNELKEIYDKVESKGVDALTEDEGLKVLALNTAFNSAQLVLNLFGTSLPEYNYIKTYMKKLKEDAGVADVYKGEVPDKKSSKGGGIKAKTMNKTDLKRYFPDQYNQLYGPGSPGYEVQQQVKEFEKQQRDLEKSMKDQIYGVKD